ncbi:alpha-L-fucosidase [Streptomyces sp. VRA16 Mangrove soil]|uniref:alpha-L-fucosidase n=1 Tax=Streptomyces sp. VRA16 Mangrove soil TaxID=2817434 RepID=UPI001A9D5215|nr:alpha-L-fucosidase [Streptomyces sp. VRA16 Mangrove soil]MBO1337946.1 alpha-L-fucosidase [Streptomyces sp. VRA16 Mangrove soil]
MTSRRQILGALGATPVIATLGSAGAHASAAAPAQAPAAGESRVRPASIIAISAEDTPEQIIAKAANVVPRKGQLAWQRREITAFTHFGMNTFTNREWGSGAEDEATFSPTAVDADQWIRTYKAMGAELAMITAKHHDGFTLFPSRYTPHSILKSPGQPNVVRRYVEAARAHQLRVGIYLSPSDGSELPHAWHATWIASLRKKQAEGGTLTSVELTALADGDRAPGGLGRFGNGSAVKEHTIPTLVEGDDRADDVRSGKLPTFTVHVNDYDAYYLNLVYELFTEYGPLDEFWLDGANPWADAGITQEYRFDAWFRVISGLSPDTVVFGGPTGIRWVGNESGIGRETEWSVVPTTADPWTYHGEWLLPHGPTAADIGSRARLTEPGVTHLSWFPAEADVSNRPGWFHHPGQQPKTADQLFDLYEKSVGRNTTLLLNVPPSKAGTIDAEDVAELTAFGQRVRKVYGGPVARNADGTTTFDRVAVREDIEYGQRVEEFAVEAEIDGVWGRIATGTTIGHQRILPLAAPVTASRVRVRVLASRAEPRLGRITLHRATG